MKQSLRYLTALPVFNEASHVTPVLNEVARYAADVLVVDDGSSDGTGAMLAARDDIRVLTHPENRGYGAALHSAFQYAVEHEYDAIVTIDCDGQHEPQRINQLVEALRHADIVSGSRYLNTPLELAQLAPADRRRINLTITQELNQRLGLTLTDAFCGFKAYRTCALQKLQLSEPGYAMPLELWVQAAHARLRIVEVPVPLIYLDEKRSFGGSLDDAQTRIDYYRRVIDKALAEVATPMTTVWDCEPYVASCGQC
ncbi:MAG: glycosyltransferase family 2 protein [Pirellulales bacterium]